MNTQLALLAKVPEFDTPFESQGKALQLRDMMHQGEVRDMDMQTRRRAIADDNTLREIYKASGGDHEAVVKGLYNRGLGGKAQALEKSRVDMDKDRATAEKTRYEAAEKRINMAGSAAKSVIDNPTPETAVAVAQYLESQGVVPAGTAAATAEKIKANPSPEFIRAQAEIAFRTAIDAKAQLPQFFNQNRGGTFAVAGVDPVTGKARDVQTAQITQSADNAASQQQSDKNNRRTVGATLENAAAQRAIAQAQNNQTNAWQNQMREIQLSEARGKQDDRTRAKQAAVDSVNAQLSVIDKALDHPGRETATGLSGTLDPRNYIPGTQSADFQAVLAQINGTAFLQAFESLKGGGQITEVEGRKATEAIARLNRSQSDAEFEASLTELRGVMEKGYERLTGQKAPQRAKPASSQAATAGPKPGTVDGGYRFKGGNAADPKNWEKQ